MSAAISPASLSALWVELHRAYRCAEYSREDAYDGEERYYAKVDADAAHWNLAYVHDAMVGGFRGGYCKEDCSHLAEGLSAEQVDGLLERINAGLKNCEAKIADPRMSRDGRTHQYHLERLKKELLARRGT